MENQNIREAISQSDMVLVGLGEEFDNEKGLKQSGEYRKGCEYLKKAKLHWLIPAWNEFCAEKAGDCRVGKSLDKLGEILGDKNYFMISVSTCSGAVRRFGEDGHGRDRAAARSGRLVAPCGSVLKKQCLKGCGEILPEVTVEEQERLNALFEELYTKGRARGAEDLLGICPECASPLILNNVYAEKYNEKGYLEQWQRYTKWLQGTLNRKIFILELGVGMHFPTVIRWPFEKVAFYNQKAYLCRINEKLYQLTEELAEKGCGISQNAIDWLEKL